MIQDRDADLLVADTAVVIDPRRLLAPDVLLAGGVVRIHHAARRRIQRLHHTNREGAFLGVTHDQRSVMSRRIENSQSMIRVSASPLN